MDNQVYEHYCSPLSDETSLALNLSFKIFGLKIPEMPKNCVQKRGKNVR